MRGTIGAVTKLGISTPSPCPNRPMRTKITGKRRPNKPQANTYFFFPVSIGECRNAITRKARSLVPGSCSCPASQHRQRIATATDGILPRRRRLTPDKSGGLNGSTQHFLEVYSQESENLKFLAGVDLNAALLCPDPTGNSRTGQFSSGNIVVRARLCFRSSHVARDSADHRSRLSHPWPP